MQFKDDDVGLSLQGQELLQ